jgi:S-adenosylmethionine synthetase
VEYHHGKLARVETVVISTQHAPEVSQEEITREIKDKVIIPVIESNLLDANTKYFVNPTGRFVIGGPFGDSGLTGRKIIVDTYGGFARHGGGAFSGKDPTKVDRSAAYGARWVAKHVVAAGLATQCEIEVAYAIGVAKPMNVTVECFGTEKISTDKISEAVQAVFDLRPAAIIKELDLRRPIYRQTASYGHMGRVDIDLPWEKLDRVDALKKAAGV